MLFTKELKIADIVEQDFKQVLLLEHLGIPFIVKEKTVEKICQEHNINPELYLHFASLFANQTSYPIPNYNSSDIACMVKYLQNSHYYYLNERANKIVYYVKQIAKEGVCSGIHLLENFVQQYINEVQNHFSYENEIVFPYMLALASNASHIPNYSITEYKQHHDNIDDKLADLKGLLIKYLPFDDDSNHLRRKLLHCLFHLEQDLKIHTLIEDTVLIPLVEKFEGKIENNQTEEKKTNVELSEREIDVLRLLLAGKSNKEVADTLHISTHTVISHRKNITAKTSIKSLAGLTIYALQNGIIEVK
jgi:regulator of cell morphogenesis and NO signaling